MEENGNENIERFTIIASQVIAGLSLAATLCTGIEATLDWREQGKSAGVVTRQQAIIQIPLSVYSLFRMLGPVMAPAAEGHWLAAGNENTCTAQGFMLLITTVAGLPLDMCLSLSFLLIIQYGWSEEETRSVSTYFYTVIVPLCLLISGFALLFNVFGYAATTCFLENPVVCEDEPSDLSEPCIPTSDALMFMRLILFAVNILHLLFSLYVMARIYLISKNTKDEENTSVDEVLSKLGMIKGFLYAACIALVQIPLALWGVLLLSGSTADLTVLEVAGSVLVPFSGFFNMLVFMLGRRQMRSSYGRLWRCILDGVVTCCCCSNCYGLGALRDN